MKQLNYVGNRKFEWFDVPEPKIESPDQIIGKPIVMGRCDGDVTASLPGIAGVLASGNHQKMVDPMVHRTLGDNPYEPPFPIGHESGPGSSDLGPFLLFGAAPSGVWR